MSKDANMSVYHDETISVGNHHHVDIGRATYSFLTKEDAQTAVSMAEKWAAQTASDIRFAVDHVFDAGKY